MATSAGILSKEAGTEAISERTVHKSLLQRPGSAPMTRNRFFLGFSANKVPADLKRDFSCRDSTSLLQNSLQSKGNAGCSSTRPAKQGTGSLPGPSTVYSPKYIHQRARNGPIRPVEAKESIQSKPAVHAKSPEPKSVNNGTLAETLYSQLSTLLSSPPRSGILGYYRSSLSLASHRPVSASLSGVKSLPTSPLSRLVVTGKGCGWEKQPRNERKLVGEVRKLEKEVREIDKAGRRSQSWYSLPANPTALTLSSSPQPSFALHITLPCQRLGHQEGQDGGSRRLVRSYWLRGKYQARRKLCSLSPSLLPST